MKNILVAAAKTGGHIYPAIAVANEFLENNHKVYFLGSGAELEKKAVSNLNLKYFSIHMIGFRGNSFLNKILITLKLPFQIIKCAHIIYMNKIETIIGFGGFITIPICTAGFIMGKSIYVHEQNSVVGSANRFISKFAKKVFLGMSLNKDIKNSLLIGNPLRKSFKAIKTNKTKDLQKINIYITGGSQGSYYLNQTLLTHLLAIIPSIQKNFFIKHQCGSGNSEKVNKFYSKKLSSDVHFNYTVKEFFESPEKCISWADLIISRAGALTLSEITSLEKGAFMIPLPSSIDNHQYLNAKNHEKIGLGITHEESDSSESLMKKLRDVIEKHRYLDWENVKKDIIHIKAANNIYEFIKKN